MGKNHVLRSWRNETLCKLWAHEAATKTASKSQCERLISFGDLRARQLKLRRT